MKRTGTVNLPLHGGKAPRWLFQRMVRLSSALTDILIYEYGRDEFLKRISDPYWFQAFSCVIGFDWHSSGTTTTSCGALKTALDPQKTGIMVAGGKGKHSRKAPSEIEIVGSEIFSLPDRKITGLLKASRMSAKVDNGCIQDSYNLYHHSFFFTEGGKWAVIQQGMNDSYARRYHWLSDNVEAFVDEPHTGICAQRMESEVLDLTAKESAESRKVSLDLVRDNPEHLERYLLKRRPQTLLSDYGGEKMDSFSMPAHHEVLEIDVGPAGIAALKKAYELQPETYEDLVSLEGMGPKRIRALALVSELVYGARASWKDPAKYSFAHGGKDGYPYPVNRKVYDATIETLRESVMQARLERKDKLYAIKRLSAYIQDDAH